MEGAVYTANARTFDLLIKRGARLHANANPATLHSDFMLVPEFFRARRMDAHGYITRRVLDLGGIPYEQQLRKFLFNACMKGATPVVSALLENGFARRKIALPRRAVYAALRYGHRETLAVPCREEVGGERYLHTPKGEKLCRRFFGAHPKTENDDKDYPFAHEDDEYWRWTICAQL